MRKSITLIGCAILLSTLIGCSTKPSAEEMKQLNDLKAEVSSLEKAISARESEKAALLKSIADKDAELVQCLKDKEALQQHIKGMQ